jgi:alkylation response protein AidB-like acyl-CoA dehydrogenase
MFALVRTDFDAPKHEGISFVLLPMDQEGVTVKPIRLISGSSPFCETFLDNAVAAKDDLVGDLNKGWTVGKRLLQFERSGIGGLSGGARPSEAGTSLPDIAKKYVGDEAGRISDPAIREKVTKLNMNRASFRLTAQRANAENKSGTPGAATSIFKLYGAALQQDGAELKRELMGFQGLGVQGEGFTEHELTSVEEWLHTKATTIYGGSNEIQANIIAKRVLGLPE